MNPLWRRELHGAERRWWRRPWVGPLAVLAATAIAEMRGTPFLPAVSDRTIRDWGRPFPDMMEARWPVVFLTACIIWSVAQALARDHPALGRDAISGTPFRPRQIALAKTFAPSAWAMFALMGLALGAVALLLLRVPLQYADSWALADLGHMYWDLATGRGATWPIQTLGVAETLLRPLLLGVTAATGTCWLATQLRPGPWPVLAATLAAVLLWGVLWAVNRYAIGPSLHGMWTETMREFSSLRVGTDPPETIRNQRAALERLRTQLIIAETLSDFLLRYGIPIIWLAYWWRWTSRGFDQLYCARE